MNHQLYLWAPLKIRSFTVFDFKTQRLNTPGTCRYKFVCRQVEILTCFKSVKPFVIRNSNKNHPNHTKQKKTYIRTFNINSSFQIHIILFALSIYLHFNPGTINNPPSQIGKTKLSTTHYLQHKVLDHGGTTGRMCHLPQTKNFQRPSRCESRGQFRR